MPTTETICRHGFASPKSCMNCMEDEGVGPEPTPPLTVEATFTARYDGRNNCSGCNLPMARGTRIARMSNGSYRHVGCT